MKAWLDSAELKARIVAQVEAHAAADEIVQGKYWENGQGCAVGCIIHGNDHSKFPAELGIPEALARLIDNIFQGLPLAQAKEVPLRFVTAIPVGADLSKTAGRFLLWLLVDPMHGVIQHVPVDRWPQQYAGVMGVADVLRRRIAGEDAATAAASAAARAAQLDALIALLEAA